ncbi:MAG TPA: hypothetical protein VF722_10895 [Gemmatimonadaceae bacterium]|jgi:hypothetical protein
MTRYARYTSAMRVLRTIAAIVAPAALLTLISGCRASGDARRPGMADTSAQQRAGTLRIKPPERRPVYPRTGPLLKPGDSSSTRDTLKRTRPGS